MKKEDFTTFLNRRIKLTCVFGSGSPIFFTGSIIKVGEESLEFLDKFNKPVLISLDDIKKVEVV